MHHLTWCLNIEQELSDTVSGCCIERTKHYFEKQTFHSSGFLD